ncbi:MAG: hypothetical protein ACK5LC_06275 [Coprobacillaceae bacterium]
MKKVLVGLLCMSFLLIGCSDSDKKDTEKKEDKVEEKEETKKEENEDTNVEATSGEWKDNVYTNESIGLTYTLPEGLKSLPEEELDDNESQIVQMFVVNEETGTSVSIVLDITGEGTEQSYIDFYTSDDISEGYDSVEVQEDIEISGHTYKHIIMIPYEGVENHMFFRKQGDTMILISINLANGESLQSFLDHFS